MEEKTKKGSSHRTGKGAGHSPIPKGPGSYPVCGHSGCGAQCQVRYVGLTSHIRDHHALHAARGITHIWAAAIVTGLAVVLTGVVAYSSVSAKSSDRGASQADWARITARLQQIETSLQETKVACASRASDETATDLLSATSSTKPGKTPPGKK